MVEYKVLDKEGWGRKEHFDFYSKFDNACFNLCVPVNAQKIYDFAKSKNESFFQIVLYAILRSANSVPQMKQRLLDSNIIEYSSLNVMTPIKTQDDGFRQIMCENTDSYLEFSKKVTMEIEGVKSSKAGPMIVKNDAFF
ncbi:CatA-like O-acetyltransferase, partial [Salmonella enterica]|nr:CatA-like O-acetyltransferase [Salmonella enterica]EJC9524598.1 CatA-like O-acetyltransferase [Salmonella enterica]